MRVSNKKCTVNPKYADYESDNPERKRRNISDKSAAKSRDKSQEKSGSQNKTVSRVVNQIDDDGAQVVIRHSDDQISENFHEESEGSDMENEDRSEKQNSAKEVRKKNLMISKILPKEVRKKNLMIVLLRHLKVMAMMVNQKRSQCISENSRKSYVVDLANDVFCNFLLEALMNTFSTYEATYCWNEFPTIF